MIGFLDQFHGIGSLAGVIPICVRGSMALLPQPLSHCVEFGARSAWFKCRKIFVCGIFSVKVWCD